MSEGHPEVLAKNSVSATNSDGKPKNKGGRPRKVDPRDAEIKMLREENAQLKRQLAGRGAAGEPSPYVQGLEAEIKRLKDEANQRTSQEAMGPEINLVEDPRVGKLKAEVARLEGEIAKKDRASGRQAHSRPAPRSGEPTCTQWCTKLHEHNR